MSEWLVGMWMNMTNDLIYKAWPLGYTQGLMLESGIFDNSPLVNFVNKVLKDYGGIKRKITVSSVDSSSGQYVITREDEVSEEEFAERVVASASIPFVFPHRHIKNWTLMDGGTVWNTNLVSAIDRCMEIVDDQSKIVLDIIILGQSKLNKTEVNSNSIGNYLRYRDIKTYSKSAADIIEFGQAYPNVTYRYFFKSSKPLTSGLQEMQFTPEVLGPMIELGKEDAKNMLQYGPGHGMKRFKQWHMEEKVRLAHPILENYLHSDQE